MRWYLNYNEIVYVHPELQDKGEFPTRENIGLSNLQRGMAGSQIQIRGISGDVTYYSQGDGIHSEFRWNRKQLMTREEYEEWADLNYKIPDDIKERGYTLESILGIA